MKGGRAGCQLSINLQVLVHLGHGRSTLSKSSWERYSLRSLLDKQKSPRCVLVTIRFKVLITTYLYLSQGPQRRAARWSVPECRPRPAAFRSRQGPGQPVQQPTENDVKISHSPITSPTLPSSPHPVSSPTAAPTTM